MIVDDPFGNYGVLFLGMALFEILQGRCFLNEFYKGLGREFKPRPNFPHETNIFPFT